MTKTGHWARRKEVREQEKNRKLRLEKAGLLKRKVQIKEIEKKKLTRKDRELVIQEENKARDSLFFCLYPDPQKVIGIIANASFTS